MYLLIYEIIIIFGVHHSGICMCTVKMLNHNICNSVIYLYYIFCLSVVYTTCTTSTITLLNNMLIYLFKFCAFFTSKYYKSTCVVMVQVITYSSV